MAKAKSGSSPSTPRKSAKAPRSTAAPAPVMDASPVLAAAESRGTAAGRGAKARGNGPTAQPQIVTTMSHDQIAKRAYEIWLAKGRPYGQDEQNWREAEASLQMELQRG